MIVSEKPGGRDDISAEYSSWFDGRFAGLSGETVMILGLRTWRDERKAGI
jgi:hypothetical protein